MQQYLETLKFVLENGTKKEDRTNTGTISYFGLQSRYDLQKGFPLITTKKIHFKSVLYELLWFLKGETNIKFLTDNGVKIWNPWADAKGELGRIYGYQWRSWTAENKNIDQLKHLVENIKSNPNSRRLIVSAWNVGDLDKMALPPCHILFQFYVAKGKLSCQLYQRSADLFIGVPFNIASYAALTMMIAQVTGLEAGEFIHTLGDAHIYLNHIEQVKQQLSRKPKPLPFLQINTEIKNLFDFKYSDFELLNYNPLPHIKGDVAI